MTDRSGVTVIDKGADGPNPLIVVNPDRVLRWLRELADELGYGDRVSCAVQVSVEHPFAEGKNFHNECPTLVLMVSNIARSKAAA